MVKAANVALIGKEYIGAGYVTVHGARRRRRGQGRDRRRRRRRPPRRRAGLGPRHPAAARRSRTDPAQGNRSVRRRRSMAEAAAPLQTDRDLASIAEARALARRAKQAWLELAEFSQEQIDAIVDAMAAAATPQAEAFARLAVEETGYGVVDDKIQKNLFSSQKVYELHPADEDGRRHRAARGPARRRDRRAVRRRRRRRAVDQPDVDGDLQDPDLAQGALRDRPQPASRGGEVHHARRRSDGRGGAPRRRARRAPSTG